MEAGTTAGPTQVEVRITALDVARGIALFGILLMNITMFGMPFAYSNPANFGGSTGADLWAWIITEMGFEGTQRGLFSLLYGAGIAIMTASLDKSTRPHAQDLFFRRTLWLVVFGIVHGFLLLWTGEILFFYGATAVFVYGLRNATPRTMIGIALGGLLFNAGWNLIDAKGPIDAHRAYVAADSVKQTLAEGDTLSTQQSDAIKKWEGMLKNHSPDSAKIAKELEVYHGGYWGILKHQAPSLTRWQSWGLYRYFFDIFSIMLLGIALLRLGIITGGKPASTYALLMLVGYVGGLAVNYWELRTILDGEFGLIAFRRAGVTYDLGRLLMTVGHLGSIMLFCKSGILPWLQRSLAAVGRMAFTNYISHSIICAIVFYGFGFGLYGELSRHQLYYVVGSIWLFQLITSPIWLRHFRFGPLEYLWRWLTYGERPAFRVASP
ncbi:MAG: DUF418 domain-containing protein [Gemmatimonadaceae bacterium]|nr:DUF418 domain-containing protein [Gemmatimonadaceae bacterium]